MRCRSKNANHVDLNHTAYQRRPKLWRKLSGGTQSEVLRDNKAVVPISARKREKEKDKDRQRERTGRYQSDTTEQRRLAEKRTRFAAQQREKRECGRECTGARGTMRLEWNLKRAALGARRVTPARILIHIIMIPPWLPPALLRIMSPELPRRANERP